MEEESGRRLEVRYEPLSKTVVKLETSICLSSAKSSNTCEYICNCRMRNTEKFQRCLFMHIAESNNE